MGNDTKTEILKVLLKQFNLKWTVTSLSEEINLSRVGIWKALKKLESEEIILISPVGKGKTSTFIINLNWRNPLLEKQLSLILTEEALKTRRWMSSFETLENIMDFLILYGSVLHSPKEANDVDLIGVVSGEDNFKKIEEELQKTQKTQEKKIHLENFTKNEFENEIKKPNKIFIDAIKKGVILFGQEKFIKFIRNLKNE